MNSLLQPQNLVFVWLSIGSIALFSFVTILGWSDHRRREKDASTRMKPSRESRRRPMARLRCWNTCAKRNCKQQKNVGREFASVG